MSRGLDWLTIFALSCDASGYIYIVFFFLFLSLSECLIKALKQDASLTPEKVTNI